MPIQKEKRAEIESLAEDVLKAAYKNRGITPPINLGIVIRDVGLQLKQLAFDDAQTAGAYDRARKTVYVAEGDYLPRQLFTIAHELGHFFLHKDKAEEIFLRMDALAIGGAKPEMETEADIFASSLLMPRELVMNHWPVLHNVSRMAHTFAVSESAMRWRLVNLKLIRYDGGE